MSNAARIRAEEDAVAAMDRDDDRWSLDDLDTLDDWAEIADYAQATVARLKEELLSRLAPVVYPNGYPIRAVSQAAVLDVFAMQGQGWLEPHAPQIAPLPEPKES